MKYSIMAGIFSLVMIFFGLSVVLGIIQSEEPADMIFFIGLYACWSIISAILEGLIKSTYVLNEIESRRKKERE